MFGKRNPLPVAENLEMAIGTSLCDSLRMANESVLPSRIPPDIEELDRVFFCY